MRRIDLSPFTVVRFGPKGNEEVPYELRDSLVSVLFAEEQHLSAVNALKNDKIANKILDCPEDSLLLEEVEYDALRSGLDATKGFSRQDVELIRRIIDAPQVEVTEKPS